MKDAGKLICERCNVEMELMETHFTYLDRSFKHKAPRCPKCGQIYIPEDLAKGRMREVEIALEEK